MIQRSSPPHIPAPCLSEYQRDIKRSKGTEIDGNACPEIDPGRLRSIGSKAPGILHLPNSTLHVEQSMEAVGEAPPIPGAGV